MRPKLLSLLGPKYYRRPVYDYYVMGKIEMVDGYLIAEMCKQHFCSSSASFMAVNLNHGDIHVAFFRSGHVEWFHTTGKAKDLPYNVLHKPLWMQGTGAVDKVDETTRGQHRKHLQRSGLSVPLNGQLAELIIKGQLSPGR